MGSRFQSRLELTEKSFMNRATLSYNLIPPELRKVPKLPSFKKKLRKWVVENIKLKQSQCQRIFMFISQMTYCNTLPSSVAKKVKMYLILKEIYYTIIKSILSRLKFLILNIWRTLKSKEGRCGALNFTQRVTFEIKNPYLSSHFPFLIILIIEVMRT